MGRQIVFQKAITIVCLMSLNFFGTSYGEYNNLDKSAKIIIVGAGPSGIAAASKLMENGFNNVTILEAEDRIGGRVYTTKFGNYTIDLGGQWVHGIDGNIAFELANPYGLLDASQTENSGLENEFLDSSGSYVNQELTRKIKDFFVEHVGIFNFEKDPTSESIGQHVEKAFDETFKNDQAVISKRKPLMEHLELIRIQEDSALSWNDVSAPGLSVFKECAGDLLVNWKERGYSTILEILMKRYPNPDNELPVLNSTILNSEVMSIDYLQNGEGPPVIVTTTKGQLYKADHVIVTVSLGVLKEKYKSLFIPPLPDYKIKTIENTGFGAVAKVFIMFDKPFWYLGDRRRILHFSFLWNEDDKKPIEVDPEREWLLGMAGALTVEKKPNLLTLWVSGKYVKLMEQLPEEKVFNHSIENINRFLGKAYNITTPLGMIRSRWYSNPHFRGVYSYRSVETHKRHVFPEMLERPLDAQTLRVLFAGEATESERYGTVDGAIKSGWKAADRLISHYKTASGSSAPAA